MTDSIVDKKPNAETGGRRANWMMALMFVILPVIVGGIFMLISALGARLPLPDQQGIAGMASSATHTLIRVLVALASVLALGAVLRRVMVFFGQPPVIGEVLAGIALGPSLIGAEWSAYVLPPSVAPYLKILADFGIILYMFLVGLELDLGVLKKRASTMLMVSQISVAAPFLMGAGLALSLYTQFATSSTSFLVFSLFMGVAMSITAFPVLARMLVDRGMQHTPLGVLALGCAAVDDVTAWCMLALAVGLAQSQSGNAILTFGGAVLFCGAMLLLARPLLEKLDAHYAHIGLPPAAMTVIFLAILLAALTTELIGIHAIFGAFLLGLLIPHEGAIAKSLSRHLLPIVTALLLPAFFAYTGMRTRIDLLDSWSHWLVCGAITLVATVGKVGGTYVAARLKKMPNRESLALGALMNTRGLVELIVLNVGLSLGVISSALFSMMTVMAIVTTLSTLPLLRLIYARRGGEAALSKGLLA